MRVREHGGGSAHLLTVTPFFLKHSLYVHTQVAIKGGLIVVFVIAIVIVTPPVIVTSRGIWGPNGVTFRGEGSSK